MQRKGRALCFSLPGAFLWPTVWWLISVRKLSLIMRGTTCCLKRGNQAQWRKAEWSSRWGILCHRTLMHRGMEVLGAWLLQSCLHCAWILSSQQALLPRDWTGTPGLDQLWCAEILSLSFFCCECWAGQIRKWPLQASLLKYSWGFETFSLLTFISQGRNEKDFTQARLKYLFSKCFWTVLTSVSPGCSGDF